MFIYRYRQKKVTLLQETAGVLTILTVFLIAAPLMGQVSVVVNTGHSVAVTGDVEIIVDGDWQNAGTLDADAGTVTFNGSGDQTITTGSGESFHNLHVNKTSGALVLAGNVSVKNTLTMESGNIDPDANTLALGEAAEGTLVHTNGRITGSFSRYIDTNTGSRAFPIGTDTHYRPVTVNYTTAPSTAGTITVSHDDAGSDADITPPLDDSGYSVDRHSGMFWTLAASGISGGSYDLSMDAMGQDGISTPAELRIVHSNDGAVYDLAGIHAAGSGTAANRSSIDGNTFGNFYLGGNITDNPFSLLSTYLKAIAAGWNMVGLPYMPGNRHYKAVFANSNDNTFFGFEGTYVPEDSFQVSTGYWLNFPADETVAISGSQIDNVTLDLAAGWNMISGISSDVAIEDVIDSSGIINPGTLFRFAGTYVPVDVIEQGGGFWINTNAAGQITLQSSGSTVVANNGAGESNDNGRANLTAAGDEGQRPTVLKTESDDTLQLSALKAARFAKVKETRENRIPTLYFEDAKGLGQELKFNVKRALEESGSDSRTAQTREDYRQHYLLPPPAPGGEGTFDARFAGNYGMSDADEALIHIQASNYPVTITAENLTAAMTLDDAQYVLVEVLDNEDGKTHQLTEGASISISNPAVKTLKLSKVTASIPTEFRMHQNYPNPFNPTTKIKYDLPAKGKVSIQIYNALGQRVRTLVSKEQEAGYYETVWDATNEFGSKVGSGVYFYRINAGEFNAVKKMILLK